MFTMQKIYRDQNAPAAYAHYFFHDDYYSEGGKQTGFWRGKLAEDLGFGKEVTPEQLTEIGNGKWQGQKLTPGIATGKTVCYHGFQCAPPKSVSIMAVVCRDERIKQAHRECVDAALAEMEKFAAIRLRTGDNHGTNAVELSGNFAVATFQHETSRALDPQMHTHCLVANCTRAKDGRLLALTESQICEAIGFCGRYYQNLLAERLKTLGYRLSPREKGFSIVGVPESVEELYSKRSDEINKVVEENEKELGRPLTDAEIAVIAKETRKEKLKNITEPEVMANCWRQLSPGEAAAIRQTKELAELSEKERRAPKHGEIVKHVASAIEAHFERASVSPRHKVVEEALARSLGRFTREEIEKEMNRQLLILREGETPETALVSTQKAVEREKHILAMIDAGRGKCPQMGDSGVANRTDLFDDGKVLSEAQQRAVRAVLSNTDAVQVFRGVAGSGKTTTLTAICKGIQGDAFFLAPTRAAVNVLKDEGFTKADTVAKFLVATPRIGKDTVLFVDESSLLDTSTGQKILATAKSAGARVVLVGDQKQHVSVGAGDFLRIVEQHTKIAATELTEIRRQRPDAYRNAIALMAAGQTLKGLEQLKEGGAVEECKAQYLDKAAKHYVAAILGNKSTILVAPTHAEIDGMTSVIRTELFAAGRLNANDRITRTAFVDYQRPAAQLRQTAGYEIGTAIRLNGEKDLHAVVEIDAKMRYLLLDDGRKINPAKTKIVAAGQLRQVDLAVGDKILLTENDKSRKLTNGDITEIVAIMPDGEIYTDKGQAIPPDYLALQYGYAVTSHKSQGQTADVAIMAAASLDEKACYVGSSRGRQEVKIYCPEYSYLANRVRKPADRLAVFDVISPKANRGAL